MNWADFNSDLVLDQLIERTLGSITKQKLSS